MDLNLNSEDLAFRDEVRAFLKDKLDPKVAEKGRAQRSGQQGRNPGLAKSPL